MSLSTILFEAVEDVSNAQFAGLVGTDGIAIEMVSLSDDLPINLEEIEVELATLTAAVSQSTSRLRSGRLQDLVLESEELTCFAAQVIPGYYAVLGMLNDGNHNRARFAIDRLVYRLQREL